MKMDIDYLNDEIRRQGLTKTVLAEKMGISPSFLYRMLNGKTDFPLNQFVKLNKLLGIELHVRKSHFKR